MKIMNLEMQYHKFLKRKFTKDLYWFEEEFDLLFKRRDKFFKHEKKIANQIINILSETINTFPNEKLQTRLVFTLNSIKNKYPKLF